MSQRSLAGFTIVEALVATAVFALAMTAIVGVFLAVLRVNERARQVRLVEQNARYITEFISREIRNGRIDYDAYGGAIPNPTNTLRLVDKDGNSASFQFSNGDVTYTRAGQTSQLDSQGINIGNFRFFIAPVVDPFGVSPGLIEQPMVTLVLEISSENSRDPATMIVQTTVSTRFYPR